MAKSTYRSWLSCAQKVLCLALIVNFASNDSRNNARTKEWERRALLGRAEMAKEREAKATGFVWCRLASVRTQSSKVKMIDSLFQPTVKDDDDGIIRDLLIDLYIISVKKKLVQIIFRDEVSESQFNQVLNVKSNKIIEAYEFLMNQ
ncbi:Protein argonaute 16 [Dendrobium catenatum]|uniref:Protein argonaute 16 n=1 Tax=Dendrobium catenatum TaxID=906689 RepID=A0A2I0VGY1_9ASPA|nr:Protein argonaute 16 [Dendrobium catenatum]